MASCSLGASNVKIPKVNLVRAKVGDLQPCSNTRKWIWRRSLHYAGLGMSRPSEKAFSVFCGPSSEAESAKNVRDGHEEPKSSGLTSQPIPNPSDLDGFRLCVTGDLTVNSIPPPPPPPPSPTPFSVNTPVDLTDSNGSVASPSFAISKPLSSSWGIQTLLDKAGDEGLVILESPKVGYFRRSRTIKGKRAPPSCKEKQIVKEGQVLCCIEQFGGEVPIESDISGEVVKILRQDGDPIGYGDALIVILPSFPLIKKLH